MVRDVGARRASPGFCALVLLIVMRRPLPPKDAFARLAIIILGVVFSFSFFTAIAMQTVPAAHGGVVLGVLPLVTAAAAVVMTGERPGIGFWVELCSARSSSPRLHCVTRRRRFSRGDFQLLLSIISGGTAYTASGSLARTMPGWEVISGHWLLVAGFASRKLGTVSGQSCCRARPTRGSASSIRR